MLDVLIVISHPDCRQSTPVEFNRVENHLNGRRGIRVTHAIDMFRMGSGVSCIGAVQ